MATFRFTLRTPDTSIVFGSDRIRNWNDIKPSITLNDTYRGVFRKFTNTFEFVADVRRLIIEAIDTHGYDCEIYLSIESGNDNADRYSFMSIAENMKAEIQTEERNELTVDLNFVDSGFASLMLARHDMAINVDVTESIDGDTLTAFPALKDIRMHDRTLIFNTKYTKLTKLGSVTENFVEIGGGTYSKFLAFPLQFDYADDQNFKNIIASIETVNGTNLGATAFYLESEKDRTVKLSMQLTGQLNIVGVVDGDFLGWRYGLVHRGASDTYTWFAESVHFGGAYPDADNVFEGTFIAFDIDYQADIAIQEGDSLEFVMQLRRNDVVTVGYVAYNEYTNLLITGVSNEYFDATNSQAILPHEYFDRQIEILTGEPGRFRSNYFGRIDLGYPVDGPGAYMVLMNSKMLRGFPFAECAFNTTFKKIFLSVSKMFNLAGSIQTIDNREYFVLERYADTMDTDNILQLGRMNGVSRSIDESRLYSDIKCGYKDYQYEEINGLYAYNGEVNFATPLKIKSETLDLISEIRTDDIGIEVTRRLQYSLNPSKDCRADKDIFMIDCTWDGARLIPVTNENFEVIAGIYEPDKAYNLNLTPGRILRNWGSEIKAGLLSKLNGSLKFIKGPANPALVTKKVGESQIVESDNVLVSELSNPLELPEIIMIAEADFSIEQWQQVIDNPAIMVQFENKGVTIFGFIKLLEFDINKKIANFELKRANY